MPVGADAEAPRAAVQRAESDHATEAQIFTHYLIGRECPATLADRYARGTALLHAHLARTDELAVTRFVVAHSWALPLLDAGAALTGKGQLLRARLQLMAAVLETTPEFANEFLPRVAPRWRVVAVVAWCGLLAVIKALAGAPLLMAVRRGTA